MGSGATKLDRRKSHTATVGNCIDCQRGFNRITRRKRECLECRGTICHVCLKHTHLNLANTDELPLSASRISLAPRTGNCRSCHILLSDDATYDTLIQLKAKHLKGFLLRRNVQQVETCIEKSHLVELILQGPDAAETTDTTLGAQLPDHLAQSDARVHPSDSPAPANGSSPGPQEEPPVPPDPRAPQPNVQPDGDTDNISTTSTDTKQEPNASKVSLSEIEKIEEVDKLTAKQLKGILINNFVNYRGCKERHELITKVKMLWESRQANKQLYEKIVNQAETTGAPTSMEEMEMCKICMDSPIDCVLLECGHMVTCTQCGKQMNECPICRQYVVRCVHIFKS